MRYGVPLGLVSWPPDEWHIEKLGHAMESPYNLCCLGPVGIFRDIFARQLVGHRDEIHLGKERACSVENLKSVLAIAYLALPNTAANFGKTERYQGIARKGNLHATGRYLDVLSESKSPILSAALVDVLCKR